MEMMHIDQFQELQNAIESVKQDDTPRVVVENDEIHVLGDPNKTETLSADYTVRFIFPNEKQWLERSRSQGDKIIGITEDGRNFMAERTFRNVYLTPRRVMNSVTTMVQLESFLFSTAVNVDGELEMKPLSKEQMVEAMEFMGDDLLDATYRLVASVLRISSTEEEFMAPINTIETAVQIVVNNKVLGNEADYFFE